MASHLDTKKEGDQRQKISSLGSEGMLFSSLHVLISTQTENKNQTNPTEHPFTESKAEE